MDPGIYSPSLLEKKKQQKSQGRIIWPFTPYCELHQLRTAVGLATAKEELFGALGRWHRRPRRRPREALPEAAGTGVRKGKGVPSKQTPGPSSAHRLAGQTPGKCRTQRGPHRSPQAQAWPGVTEVRTLSKSEKSHSSIRCWVLLSSTKHPQLVDF